MEGEYCWAPVKSLAVDLCLCLASIFAVFNAETSSILLFAEEALNEAYNKSDDVMVWNGFVVLDWSPLTARIQVRLLRAPDLIISVDIEVFKEGVLVVIL